MNTVEDHAVGTATSDVEDQLSGVSTELGQISPTAQPTQITGPNICSVCSRALGRDHQPPRTRLSAG